MKKFLSLVLALAIVASCFVMVQFFTSAENAWTDIIKQDYSGATIDTAINSCKGSATNVIRTKDAESGSMKFTVKGSAMSPAWKIGGSLLSFANSHNTSEYLEVKISMKVKLESMPLQESPVILQVYRDEQDTMSGATGSQHHTDVYQFTETATTFDWTTVEKVLKIKTADVIANVSTAKFVVYLKNIKGSTASPAVGYVDDVVIQVREYEPPIDHTGDVAGEFHYDLESADYIPTYLSKTGSVGIAQDKTQKHGGEASLKFAGTSEAAENDGIKLTHAAVSKVVVPTETRYEVSAWFYFTSVDASATSIKAQGTANGVSPVRSEENYDNTIVKDTWFKARMILELSPELLASDTLEFWFTSGCGKCTFYVDDISIRVADPAPTPSTVTEVTGITWGNGANLGATVTDMGEYAKSSGSAAYSSASADIKAAVTELMGANNSVEVIISCEAKGEAALANQVEGLVRGITNGSYAGMPSTSDATAWNSWYASETSNVGQMKDFTPNVFKNMGKADMGTTFTKISFKMTFCKKDLAIFNYLYFCFDKLTGGVAVDLKPVTVTLASAAHEEEVKTPAGLKFTALTDTDEKSTSYMATDVGVISSEVTNGTYSKTFTVVNNGTQAIKIAFDIQTTHKYGEGDASKTWTGPNADYKYQVIEPGKTAELTYVMTVKDGMVEINKNDSKKTYPLSAFFYRFTLENGDGKNLLPAGTSFTVACTGDDYVAFNGVLPSPGKEAVWKSEPVYEIGGESGTGSEEVKVPVGAKFILNEDVDAQTYVLTSAGTVTGTNNGKLKKSFKVQNNGKETLKISFCIQTTHIISETSKVWAGPGEDYNVVEIPAGKSATLTYEMDVKDGMVEISKNDVTKSYALSSFFYRFDIKNAEGKNSLTKGTSFTIYAEGDDFTAISAASISTKGKWTVETVYSVSGKGSGDMLPVAFIACFAVASVALVIVAKKKKENEAA